MRPVLLAGSVALLLAACSSTSKTASTTSSSTTTSSVASASVPGEGTAGSGSSSGACALLTSDQIAQATGITPAPAVADDSQASAGEQNCSWALDATTTSGTAGLGGVLVLNLETGANAIPNFTQLSNNPSIPATPVSGVGDAAVMTQGLNLFVKKGDKVIEISYQGVPGESTQTILTQLAQHALTQM